MNVKNSTRRIASFGIMLAVITVLSYIEHMLPPLPSVMPNLKLGLSNIVTMYYLFFVGKKDALMLACFKSAFVFLIRGPVAAMLSLTGGILSLLIIMMVSAALPKASYLFLSILGAIFHNIGQIAAASLLLQYNIVIYYLPISIVAGIIMGTATGTLLKITIPLFDRIEK